MRKICSYAKERGKRSPDHSWEWVPSHPSCNLGEKLQCQALCLICIFCDLTLPLILIVYLKGHQILHLDLFSHLDQSEASAGVTKQEERKQDKERS